MRARDGGRDDKEFMATLAKGLAVLGTFDKARPAVTLSQEAQATGLSGATARRIKRTLTELGYVLKNGRQFSLSSGILKLGFAYLATQNWIEQASPLMRQLSEQFHESCSAAILQGSEIVYVARFPAGRIMSVTLAVGTRLPAFHTALGRIQLGFLDEAEVWCRLKSLRVEAYTPSTITDIQALFDRVREDHAQGFSIVDKLPTVNASFVVLEGADISRAQRVFSLLKTLSTALPVLGILSLLAVAEQISASVV